MTISHEGEIYLAQLRAKRAAGTELSIEEMRRVVQIMAEGRSAASEASAASRRKTASSVVRSAEDMLKGLGL